MSRQALQKRYPGRSVQRQKHPSGVEYVCKRSCGFFKNVPSIIKKIKTLQDVGLGYIKLGQPSTTLSGGECQRVKLAAELSRTSTGNTLYILDEPTTGLHFEDVKVLLGILYRLTDKGNTVLIIEHHPDIIAGADYIIDMGPEGGGEGGRVVDCGTPEMLAQNNRSHTGQFLREWLKKQNHEEITTYIK